MTNTASQFKPVSFATDVAVEEMRATEKAKMTNANSALSAVFPGEIQVENLREKFLFNTFEIIAEKGAEALSASELIKKTKSSKGALFHHFETIDHLCIESLVFFKKHLQKQRPELTFENLDQFIKFYVETTVRQQATSAYTHLTHFFRDRAIRDARYRDALQAIFDVNINFTTDRIMQFLSPSANREVVRAKVIFMSMTIERTCFYRVLYENPTACQNELDTFVEFMKADFKKLT